MERQNRSTGNIPERTRVVLLEMADNHAFDFGCPAGSLPDLDILDGPSMATLTVPVSMTHPSPAIDPGCRAQR